MTHNIKVPSRPIVQTMDIEMWEQGVHCEDNEWVGQLWEQLDQQEQQDGENFTKHRVYWEPASKGPWTLERAVIDKRSRSRLSHVLAMNDISRDCGHGDVTLLKKDGEVWMSDTDAEIREHAPILNKMWWLRNSEFTILINGLGLGMVAKAALDYGAAKVDVVEIDKDVIDIVAPNFNDPRITIHHADAFTVRWPRYSTWTLAWHDIWQNISGDNIKEMDRLKTKYRHKVQWQGYWQRSGCLRMRRDNKRLEAALLAGDWKTVKQIDPAF